MSTLTAHVASAAAAVNGLAALAELRELKNSSLAVDCRPRCGWKVDTELKLLCIQFECFFDHHGPAAKISGPD
jgi:hypothetical protein